MNRARSPLFGVPPRLVLALTLALGCAHAPEQAPAAEEHPTAHPAPPPTKEPAPAPAPPPKPAPGKTAERSPKAERPSGGASASTSAGKSAPGGKSAAAPAKEPAPAAPPVAARPEPGTAGEYFPLAVGNEWMYVDQSPALPQNRRGVLRTVRILERTADGFYRDNERGNLRVDGNCVRDRDRRLLCLPFTVGATWSSVLSATTIERYEIASAGETVETPAGKFERCVRVRAHNRVKASIDQVLEITYAPRVGPVLIETYVVVDGRVTPQVKAMLQSYKLAGGF
jgi:hypothetical protein